MIYILSEPIQTGKTSRILDAASKHSHIGGFLTPTIDGNRVIKNLCTDQEVVFEVNKESEATISIGKFTFKKSAFSKASYWTIDHYNQNDVKYIIIDELGKLELREKGFYKLITQLLKYEWTDKHLILIIRDYLLEDAIFKYKIADYTLISKDEVTLLFNRVI